MYRRLGPTGRHASHARARERFVKPDSECALGAIECQNPSGPLFRAMPMHRGQRNRALPPLAGPAVDLGVPREGRARDAHNALGPYLNCRYGHRLWQSKWVGDRHESRPFTAPPNPALTQTGRNGQQTPYSRLVTEREVRSGVRQIIHRVVVLAAGFVDTVGECRHLAALRSDLAGEAVEL